MIGSFWQHFSLADRGRRLRASPEDSIAIEIALGSIRSIVSERFDVQTETGEIRVELIELRIRHLMAVARWQVGVWTESKQEVAFFELALIDRITPNRPDVGPVDPAALEPSASRELPGGDRDETARRCALHQLAHESYSPVAPGHMMQHAKERDEVEWTFGQILARRSRGQEIGLDELDLFRQLRREAFTRRIEKRGTRVDADIAESMVGIGEERREAGVAAAHVEDRECRRS
jgi:hypothetical protein